jgi:arginine deiminase
MTPEIPNSPTMPMSTLQDGLTGLWKLQLRREHATLLEKANANTKRLEQLAAETNKNKKDFDERMAVLETTILNLQSEERKDRRAFEQYAEEMATLKLQMGIVMDKLDTHDQRLNEGEFIQFYLGSFVTHIE